ncbi:MAG: phage terminase small subunit [Klebsiella pneumoniae]|uniref:phage terminase small subunit n=1 Tax=Klebsiella pneumoniae TaxID=573 RepID=UPI000E2BA1D1|nr:phage terminase small subunit [Klebsiella pneumoniae]MCM6534383.1 phage terminase small subunit [Klebsiella pneumoniae]MDU5277798.1 phage terminase small subunit [Klebsiella pneumoniae]MDU6752623.1 phage terminase small subunit [Klebsiella pneumoniae]SXW07722.1 phage terminase [Klebsiella pneumoniae]HBR4841655.1 terminase [Klebsiella pneumoniae]
MLTPAQKHFQKVMAERHGKTDDLSDTARTAHEQIMHRLRMDQSALKRVQSDQAKAAMKRQLLPHYEGWIEGTLDGDSGRQDEVIVTLMVWAIDAGDYVLAARIGRYVVTHGLLMPDRFNRTAATVLVDEICDPILVQVKADDTTDVTPYLAVLDEVAEFTAGSDMPDVVRAKLCKVRAFALHNGTTEEQATALELLRQALTLDAGAGVKKEIDRLARVVKKTAAQTGADGADSADGSDGTGDAGEDSAGAGEAAAPSEPAVVASATATKATRKSPARKTAARKTTAKKTPAAKK